MNVKLDEKHGKRRKLMVSQGKVLVFDLETAPIVSYTWGLFDQNVGLNQIKEDWYILAWAAKWLGDSPDKLIYRDNRNAKDQKNDKVLVVELAALLNEADIIITQNGDAFDVKKLNARAVIHKLPPIKPCKSVDILKEGRKVFKFTSHKLEYVTDILNDKYKKLKHEKYPGFELWKAILAGDKKAWVEMEKYCAYDVLATEESYQKIQGWIKTKAIHEDDTERPACKCGSHHLVAKGFAYTLVGKYQQYQCRDCRKWMRGSINLLSFEQRRKVLRDIK